MNQAGAERQQRKGVVFQTEHFYVGFNYPRQPGQLGRIFLNGVYFANVFQLVVDNDPGFNGLWHFNRDRLALEMECPALPLQPDVQALLQELEAWYGTRSQGL